MTDGSMPNNADKGGWSAAPPSLALMPPSAVLTEYNLVVRDDLGGDEAEE